MSIIRGSKYSNYLNGTNSNDVIYGYSGNDTILGNKGNDVIYGGDGNDVFFKVDNISFVEKFWGTEGADRMYGGRGNDKYLVDNTKDVIVEYQGQGIDTVYTNLRTYTLPDNVENAWQIIAGNKNLYGNSLNNVLHGNCGWNLISGGNGNDTIFGGGYGHDTLIGGNGNDVLVASTRVCKLYGEQGNDVIIGCYGSDTLCGGSGSDSYSGFYRNLDNDGVQFKIGFGNDIIRDFTNYNTYASNTYGTDTINLSTFKLSQVRINAIDIDKDGRLDGLYINCGKYGSVKIEHYFDDSSKTLSHLHSGDGCIERILFDHQIMHFNDVVNYL
ncbi:MAG: calcium-binding protein [Candidatus Gastranaerophilales bacterium]|nr:calcium-binding protein [Candidatus Gastranaerophilales bacterium]